jgi:hypothetical protein
MKNCYCSKCLQQRKEKEFSKWAEDESKPHLCNFCIEDFEEHKAQELEEKARKIKRQISEVK